MKEILLDPRKALAYFWSPVCAYLLWYILHRWGDKVEIVTLIIGLIGGTIIGSIFGMYYGASHSKNSAQLDNTNTRVDDTMMHPQSSKPSVPIVSLLIIALCLLAGCRSTKKIQHSESTQINASSFDSSKTAVKTSADTASKVLQVTKSGFNISIKNPVFAHVDWTNDSIDHTVNSWVKVEGVWTALFDKMISADGIDISGSNYDSSRSEIAGSHDYDSSHEQSSGKDTTTIFENTDSYQEKEQGHDRLLLWLIPVALILACFNRGWLIGKAVKMFS